MSNLREWLLLIQALSLMILAVILYLTGKNMNRVWSAMSQELWLLRDSMRKDRSTGLSETLAGGSEISSPNLPEDKF